MVTLFREENWRGQGVLVDFSDIVSLHGEWHEIYYRRMQIESYFTRFIHKKQ